MGTLYSVKIAQTVAPKKLEEIKKQTTNELAKINDQMSPFQKNSEISNFNNASANETQKISPQFSKVLQLASKLNRITDGAFDPTIAPLIDLWGFGPSENEYKPTESQISDALKNTGFENIKIENGNLSKLRNEITLNLSAIAKGYGVDAIANVLHENQITNFLVEIGGEIVTSGKNSAGKNWQIGIEFPALSETQTETLAGVIEISGKACATSGDYHNYKTDENGTVYSHILDPRNGRPTRSTLASVTVIANTCAEADGIATALFVMGTENGLKWINENPEFQALFLDRTESGKIISTFSNDFEKQTNYKSATK